MNLGEISAYFESGNHARSAGTISYNKSDPGGKSYGKYQIAIRPGTLKRYIAWSIFNQEFKNVNPGTEEFDAIWKRLAEEKPEEFEEDQFKFIKLTHYDSVERLAKEYGFDTTNRAIQEALFSIGVQHGRTAVILKNALLLRNKTNNNDIDNLYDARIAYVKSLPLAQKMKDTLLQRYSFERSLVHQYYAEPQSDLKSLLQHLPHTHQEKVADNTK